MTELPRVLLCAFEVLPSPTGTSRRITEYLRALADRFQVVVLTTKTEDLSHIARYEDARLLRVPVGDGDLASRVQIYDRAMRRQLASEDYALVHFFDPYCGYAVCEQKPGAPFKVVYDASHFPSQELRYRSPALAQDRRLVARLRRQELFSLMNADRVITASELTRRFILSLGVASELVEVVRAPAAIAPPPPPEPPCPPLQLLYLGSRYPWNDLTTLLEAFRRLPGQVQARLKLVAPEHEGAAPLALPPNVEHLSGVQPEEVPACVAGAHLGLIPLADLDRNRLQGSPLSEVSELFAAGKPVIAADLPAAREQIPDSAAVFYTPGDPDSLAAAIAALAADPGRRRELGASALAYAQRHLDAALIRNQLLALYARLLGRELTGIAPEELATAALTSTGTPTKRTLAGTDTQRRSAPKRSRRSEGSNTAKVTAASVAAPTSGPPAAVTPPVAAVPVPPAQVPGGSSAPVAPAAAPGATPGPAATPVPPPAAPSVPGAAAAPGPAAPPVVPPAPPSVPVAAAAPGPAAPPVVPPAASSVPVPAAAPGPAATPAPPPAPSSVPVPAAAPGPAGGTAASGSSPGSVAARAHLGVAASPSAPGPAPATPVEPPRSPPRVRSGKTPMPRRTPGPPRTPRGAPAELDDIEEISADEVMEADDPQAPALPPSRLDPWLAQLVHGYCPPATTDFARPTPPTTFPGRDGRSR